MVQTRYVHFRVSNEQMNRIKSNAGVAGYKTVSTYARDRILNTAGDITMKINNVDNNVAKIFMRLDDIEKNVEIIIETVRKALH